MHNSDRDNSNFPALTDANYSEWAIRMEADLIEKELWEYVFGEVEEPSGDLAKSKKDLVEYLAKLRQTRARLIRRVTAGQLPHMMDTDPKKVWEELKRVHRAGGFGSKLAMRRRFINAKMKGGELMAAWIARVRGLSFALKAIGSAPTEEDIILVLTNGLPLTYESFVIALDATPATDVTLINVISRLANEEGRQDTVRTEEDPAHDPALSSLAAVAKVHRSRSDITCFECGERGHYRSECPDRKVVKKGKQDTAAVVDGGEELFAF